MRVGAVIGWVVILNAPASAQESVPAASEASARWSYLPLFESAPATGPKYGAAVMATKAHRVEGTRPSSLLASAVVTPEGEHRTMVELDRWSANNKWRVQLFVRSQNQPLPLHREYVDESESDAWLLDRRGHDAGVSLQRKIGSTRWLLLGMRQSRYDVDGWPPCGGPGFGGVTDCGTPMGPGQITTYDAGIVSDSRDHVFAPTSGRLREFTLGFGRTGPWSEAIREYRLRFDARRYRTLARGSVLATQFVLAEVADNSAAGEAPFGDLPTVRGYPAGRYRASSFLSAQVEWRSRIQGRWGWAAFGGGARVWAPEGLDVRTLPTAGAGLRYVLDRDRQTRIRVDLAIGAHGHRQLHLAFNEAF